jgi:hypothetical protein
VLMCKMCAVLCLRCAVLCRSVPLTRVCPRFSGFCCQHRKTLHPEIDSFVKEQEEILTAAAHRQQSRVRAARVMAARNTALAEAPRAGPPSKSAGAAQGLGFDGNAPKASGSARDLSRMTSTPDGGRVKVGAPHSTGGHGHGHASAAGGGPGALSRAATVGGSKPTVEQLANDPFYQHANARRGSVLTEDDSMMLDVLRHPVGLEYFIRFLMQEKRDESIRVCDSDAQCAHASPIRAHAPCAVLRVCGVWRCCACVVCGAAVLGAHLRVP